MSATPGLVFQTTKARGKTVWMVSVDAEKTSVLQNFTRFAICHELFSVEELKSLYGYAIVHNAPQALLNHFEKLLNNVPA